LIRNGSEYEIRFGGKDLLSLRGPGVGDNDARAVTDFGTDIDAVLGAGDKAIQQAKITQGHGRAGLQGDDAARGMIKGAQAFDYTKPAKRPRPTPLPVVKACIFRRRSGLRRPRSRGWRLTVDTARLQNLPKV